MAIKVSLIPAEVIELAEVYLTPADIARELQLDPSAPVRWIRRGVLLTGSVRQYLQYVRTPGGYRVKRKWLDAFLQAITDDRAGKVNPAPKCVKSARIERMDADLAAVGFRG